MPGTRPSDWTLFATPTNSSPDPAGPLSPGSPPGPTGSRPMHLIGESAGTCFLIGLLATVPVPATPTEQHPLVQGAGTPSVSQWEGTAFQPQFPQIGSAKCLLPPDTLPPHPAQRTRPHPLPFRTPRLEHHGGTLSLSRAPTKLRDPYLLPPPRPGAGPFLSPNLMSKPPFPVCFPSPGPEAPPTLPPKDPWARRPRAGTHGRRVRSWGWRGGERKEGGSGRPGRGRKGEAGRGTWSRKGGAG